MRARPTIYTLTEYTPRLLPPDALDELAAAILWRRYCAQVDVEPPSFRTDNQWRLTPRGWAGWLPLTRQTGLLLQPKVPLHDLLGMIELAYDLRSLHFLPGEAYVTTLPGLYNHLARLLARMVLARARRGLHRAYLTTQAEVTTVRGRIRTSALARNPARVKLPCAYQELTADIEDNRILAWTLATILRGRFTGHDADAASVAYDDATHTLVQQAHRALAGQVTPTPVDAADCRGRAYTRLNADYRSLHALCAFFLDHSAPTHHAGEEEMIPFLINLERLYERCVAAWLTAHLGSDYRVTAQVRTPVGTSAALHFAIDLLIQVAPVGLDGSGTRWVLDTKYKVPEAGPDPADVAQVLAYAQVQAAQQAILVYPQPLPRPLDTQVQGIRLRTLTFDLSGDLDAAGRRLLAALQQ